MTDTKEELLCPACSKVMKKIFVESANCYIDICTEGCGGIWFDNRELEKFDEKNENCDEILKELADEDFAPVVNKKRWCPVCATPLVKNFTSTNQKIQIDECYNCGGRFLDHGELQAIRAEFDSSTQGDEIASDTFKQKFSQNLSEQKLDLYRLQQRPSLFRFINNILNN